MKKTVKFTIDNRIFNSLFNWNLRSDDTGVFDVAELDRVLGFDLTGCYFRLDRRGLEFGN